MYISYTYVTVYIYADRKTDRSIARKLNIQVDKFTHIRIRTHTCNYVYLFVNSLF